MNTVTPALESAHRDPEDAPHMRHFEALYRGQFAFVWSVARHLGVPASALDDVVQDVFLAAYRRFDHLRFEVSPRAWLFGVTRHVSFRYQRGAARWTRRHGAFADLARKHADPPQQRHDDAQQLDRLLARLGDATRTVWQMTEVLGMSAPEIASELGVPLNTVYSRLRLAREQLRTMVADPRALEDWRDTARRRHDPPASAQQRSWALLVPALGKGGLGGGGVLAWVKTQIGMATTLLATGAVAVGLSLRPGPSPAPPAPADPGAPAPIHGVVPSPPAAPTSPPVVVELVGKPGPARRLSSRTASEAAAQARLAEEVALIDRARARLAASEWSAALATLDAHAQRFPDGALADVREAARVDALCRGGDAVAAEASARRLAAEHPGSAVAQSLADFRCVR